MKNPACLAARGPLALCSALARLQAWTGAPRGGGPARRHWCPSGRREAEGRGQARGRAGSPEEGPGGRAEPRCLLRLCRPREPAATDSPGALPGGSTDAAASPRGGAVQPPNPDSLLGRGAGETTAPSATAAPAIPSPSTRGGLSPPAGGEGRAGCALPRLQRACPEPHEALAAGTEHCLYEAASGFSRTKRSPVRAGDGRSPGGGG